MAPTIERIGSGCASNPMRVLISLTAPMQGLRHDKQNADCRCSKMVGYRDPTYWLRNDWYEPCPVQYRFLLYRHLSLVCCWIYVERQSDNGSPHWGICFAASWLS